MPHERLQDFVIIDYTKEVVILAIIGSEDKELIVGVQEKGDFFLFDRFFNF